MPVVRDVEVLVDGTVGSGTEVDLPVSAAVERLFVGSGEHPIHTTFSGDVTVAFAARAPAAPPVAGTLHDTWLDVRPPTRYGPATAAEAGASEGERTLSFLGIKPRKAPLASGGILIESIEPGSRAEAARLLAGDVVTELDGVRVLSLADVLTAPGERAAWLKIRRGGRPHEEVARVSLLGWKPPAAAALLAPLLIVSLAAVLLLLFFAPTPGVVAWLERSVSRRLLARPRPTQGSRVATLTAATTRVLGKRSTVYLTAAGASVVFALLPFSHYLGLGEVDAGILFLVSVTALATLGLFTGGSLAPHAYTIPAGLRAAARVLSLAVPAAASVVAVVMTTGSLRLEDIVRAQAGWPWGWTAFRSPLAMILLGLSFVSLLAGGHVEAGPLPEAEPAVLTSSPFPRGVLACARARLFFFAEWAYVLVLCAAGAAVFLGGWQMPGLAPEQMEAQLGWTCLGALLYVVKVWSLVLAVVVGQWVLPRPLAGQTMSLCWRWVIPLSVAATLLTALWVAWGPGPSVETLVGAVMVALTVAAGLHVVARVRYFLGAPAPQLDPFL